ncbi:MAG: hypothetical protein MUE85_06645 [Microscillaceae bacterium]|jgi:hypothetical protein|nr:hypothetical protein [Microscillaceae bacterium]
MGNQFENRFQVINNLEFQILNYQDEVIYHYTYFPETHLCSYYFVGFFSDRDALDCYKRMAAFARENQQLVRKSLVDLSRIEGSFDGINEWLFTKFVPQSVALGLRYTAVVRSQEFYSNLAIEEQDSLIASVTASLDYQHVFFDNYQEAWAWLQNQP